MCFEMGVFLFCFRSSSDIPTEMPVPQGLICLNDRELERLTAQQQGKGKKRGKCNDTKRDINMLFITIKCNTVFFSPGRQEKMLAIYISRNKQTFHVNICRDVFICVLLFSKQRCIQFQLQ